VHDEIEKRLNDRVALIDQLETLYGDLGEDSEGFNRSCDTQTSSSGKGSRDRKSGKGSRDRKDTS